MTIPDLPEPQAVALTPAEKNARHWQVISTFCTFVAGYALIHKLIIPFCLKFTQVTQTPYSQIDPYFLHPVLLAYFLHREKRNTPLISLFCGFGIVYGLVEIVHTSQGLYEGWLAVSRLLSAVPLAIASGYVMSQPSEERRFSWAWSGALLGALAYFMPVMNPAAQQLIPEGAVKKEIPQYAINPRECGNTELVLDLGQAYPKSSEIQISPDCGLKPAIIEPAGEVVTVSNQTPMPVNIHLMVVERGNQSARWNMMVPPGGKLTTPKIPRQGLEAGFLYSDNLPMVGVVGVILAETREEKRFHISRSPLRIQEIP